MRKKLMFLVLIAAVLVISACTAAPERSASDTVLGESVGTVSFPVSCKSEAAALVERGVAVMHHMTYASAQKIFQEAAEADPECGMALWGIAMTYIHPLWSDRPTPEILARGAELTTKARRLVETDRERAYVETVGAYYDDGDTLTESERLVRFEAAWQNVREANPQDLEAAAPTDTNDMIVTGDATFLANLDAFIDSDKCLSGHRGEIMTRNSCETGWVGILSLSLVQEISLWSDTKLDLILNIENFGNLINSDWGRVDSYSAPSNVALANVTIAGGQYVYAPISGTQVSPETIAPKPAIARLPSVYRVQFGLKFRF